MTYIGHYCPGRKVIHLGQWTLDRECIDCGRKKEPGQGHAVFMTPPKTANCPSKIYPDDGEEFV